MRKCHSLQINVSFGNVSFCIVNFEFLLSRNTQKLTPNQEMQWNNSLFFVFSYWIFEMHICIFTLKYSFKGCLSNYHNNKEKNRSCWTSYGDWITAWTVSSTPHRCVPRFWCILSGTLRVWVELAPHKVKNIPSTQIALRIPPPLAALVQSRSLKDAE